MRKGENTSKDKLLQLKPCEHRVIIPLFIPHEIDYYRDAYQIFEICLKSVIKTSKSPLKVSVISDSCSENVIKKLIELKTQGLIDELIIETENLGKINCILRALRNTQERYITITDADVMFLNDWEAAVLDVFEAFPKAGVVCPVPVFRTQSRLTANIWINYLFSKKLKFSPVKNPEALTKFAKSIGWPWLDEKWKDAIATLEAKNGTFAVVGSSHFVATYKREIFDQLPKTDSKFQLGGNSEFLYTDEPVLKMGGYRLSTYDNFAYHMGNELEGWVEDTFVKLKEEPKEFKSFVDLNKLKESKFKYFLFTTLYKFIFGFKNLKIAILKSKGLSKNQINNFIQ